MTSRAARGRSANPVFVALTRATARSSHAEPPDLDPQSRAMRFVGMLRAERAGEQHIPRRVPRPRFAERARKREQHRAPCKRHEDVPLAHEIAAGVDDKRVRSEQRFDLLEQERALLAARDQPRRRHVEDGAGLIDLRHERRNARPARGFLGAGERRARRRGADTPHGYPADRELMDGAQRRRKSREIELRKLALGIVEASDQEQAPDLEIARMGGVRPVAMRFQGCRCRGERLRGPAQVARSERDLGLGDDASRASESLSRTEGAPCPPHQRFRAAEIAELGHGYAAKRERRRIVAQGDVVQRAKRITQRERARRGRNQRVHPNPDTLVTPGRPTTDGKSIPHSPPGKPPQKRGRRPGQRKERRDDDTYDRRT